MSKIGKTLFVSAFSSFPQPSTSPPSPSLSIYPHCQPERPSRRSSMSNLIQPSFVKAQNIPVVPLGKPRPSSTSTAGLSTSLMSSTKLRSSPCPSTGTTRIPLCRRLPLAIYNLVVRFPWLQRHAHDDPETARTFHSIFACCQHHCLTPSQDLPNSPHNIQQQLADR
jgi:hypothetical protein